MIRVWMEREKPPAPPFRMGPKVLVVAYFATAELGCFLRLGWPFPHLVADLFVEFRASTNGFALPHGQGLLGALEWFGLNGIEAAKKDFLRKRILAGGPYSGEERQAILDYCQTDVEALQKLCPHLLAETGNLTLALWRGEYMKVIAAAEHNGIPVDRALYHHMTEHWSGLQSSVIDRINRTIPVFEDGHFRSTRFRSWLEDHHLLADWPTTPTGELALDEGTFRDAALRCPEVEPLRQVRQMLGQMRRPDLTIGADGRNRCLLSPYRTKTGRNAPSTTKFIFGAPSYMRALIRPEPGKALAYIDWEHQEFGIAAALSGDPRMQSAYESGDPYLSFAAYAGAVPAHAIKESHPRERALFKVVTLGTQYLIGANGLARQLGVTLQEAADLLEHHHRIFRKFWEWSDAVSDYGQLHHELIAAFGWRMRVSSATSLRTLRNFPMQANGAEMLRLACIFARETGVSVLAPVHDAVLIEAEEPVIEHTVALAETAMRRASEAVLAGFPLRTAVHIIHPPDRFHDERGVTMWNWLMDSLELLKAA